MKVATDEMGYLTNVTLAATLYRKWKGSGPVDLVELREIIRRERKVYESGVLPCSKGLLREIRHEQAIVGRLCNLEAQRCIGNPR